MWQGDPLGGIGAISATVFAAVVGVLTAAFYVAGLKYFFPPGDRASAEKRDSSGQP
ncbi:hypothetical protein ACPOL_3920 [Acidisarcina polymorpha]|uniref:Uncharacterized protein n=1 Tax=Acidisarcina polymorpha TaxID=2211140 RepID=A0A2Z5G2D7_9BACT|nr:hypothetical protein ACPOL_3920 [Acidisarcina polymorpha]